MTGPKVLRHDFFYVSTPFLLVVDTYPDGCEAPPEGSTPVMLVVDTYPVGCEAPPEGSTPVMLVMDEVK